MSRLASTAAVALVAVSIGCGGAVEPVVVPGIDVCAECSMVIDRVKESSGYVHDGQFVVFDSPVCLVRAYERLRHEGAAMPEAVFFANYTDGTLHPAESVTFLITSHVRTTMGGGVLGFADRQDAENLRSHPDEVLTDWVGLRAARGEPDREIAVVVGVEGMSPEIVEVDKGDLMLWTIRGNGLDQDMTLSIRGYPEVAPVIVPADGEPVTWRVLAVRPGAGFPVVVGEQDRSLGMMRVAGAHTMDEEAL